MATSSRSSYERLLQAIREELAPVNSKLDKLEATLDGKYYTRENVDDKLKEVNTKHDNLAAEVQRQAQSWQATTAKWAAYASVVYVALQIAHALKLF